MPDPRCCLVATVRNEGPYLLEWVAWHRMIGFTDVIVFQNDSDDLTHETLRELSNLGLVEYRYNAAPRGRHQVRAYQRACRQEAYKASDWIMALDLDEFLTFNGPVSTIAQWLDTVPDADRILVNWRHFGSNGLILPPDGLVSEAFTMAEENDRISETLVPFKTFFRREAYWRPGIHKPAEHHPIPEDWPTPRTINGSGLREGEFDLRNFRSTDPALRRYAQVNHYIVRDAGSFLLKSTRGSAHQDHRRIEHRFWARRNLNQVRDDGFARHAAGLWQQMRDYDEASGGRLLALRTQAIDRHRRRIMALMAQPENRDLYYFCAGIDPAAEIESQSPAAG